MAGLLVALAWIIAGIWSATSSSHNGYHDGSASDGVSGAKPPETSGFTRQPTKPLAAHRSSSGRRRSGETPGDWGSWQTGTSRDGCKAQARAIRSLLNAVHARLRPSSPWAWPIDAARGDR